MNLSNLIIDHPVASGLSVASAIVVFGLLIYGLRDLIHFRFRRTWAIGGVVFRENIRRKILWLTPLVMLAIIVCTGLQQADDELDAIRQTVQFSMFASGLLVVITGIMLACTNLPRDIESKVIFTLVTKPVTRLEIVLGKIIGFARVTGAILVLMGLFTWGYVHVRSFQLHRGIVAELQLPELDAFKRGRLEHHEREGLLDTRDLARPASMSMLAREPSAGDAGVRWASTSQSFIVPFRTTTQDFVPAGVAPAPGQTEVQPGANGLRVTATLRADQIGQVQRPELAIHPPMLPPDDAPSVFGDAEFGVSIVSLDTPGDAQELVPAGSINGNKPFSVKPDKGGKSVTVTLDPRVVSGIASLHTRWGLAITPSNANYLLGMKPGDLSVVVPGQTPQEDRTLNPDAGPDGKLPTLLTMGQAGRTGRLLEGPREGYNAVAVATFAGREPRASGDTQTVTLELTMDVERDEDDANVDTTQVEVQVVNAASGERSEKLYVTPEQRRTAYAEFPAKYFAGGTFDVLLHTATRGHSVSLDVGSVSVVQARYSFGVNLAKALFSQWMLSVLVVTIGMFCSTFLSWPIAIVLSVVILMGHWAVNQVSDSLQPGIGAAIVNDFGATDPTQARVISTAFDNLAKALNFVSQFLPDIDAFSVTDSLQRGLLIPLGSVGGAALVLLLFTLPLLTLSYVILRNEEVAP